MCQRFINSVLLKHLMSALLCFGILASCATQPKQSSDSGSSVRDRLAAIKAGGKSTDSTEETADEATDESESTETTIGGTPSVSPEKAEAEAYVENLAYTLPSPIERTRPRPEVQKETRKLYDDALKAMEKGQKNNDFEEARTLLEQVEQANPQLSGPRANIAMTYMHEKNYEEAEKHFLKALEINDENEFVHFNLALCYKEQGKFSAARESYQKAIALEPRFAEAHYNLGILAELFLQDLELAIQSFEHYKLALRKNDPEVDTWILDLRNRLKAALEYEAKMEAYEQAKAEAQENPEQAQTTNEDADSDSNLETPAADEQTSNDNSTENTVDSEPTEETTVTENSDSPEPSEESIE